ncbi:MAG: cytochrome c peroxidase [Myxococcota bacterium]
MRVIMMLGVMGLWGCTEEVPILHTEPFPEPVPTDSGLFDTDHQKFELGQALFFDRELSGNRNIACATCHLPFLQTAEPLPLSIGEGGEGVGPTRRLGGGAIIARNTTDLFNRAHADAVLFWDGRVARNPDGAIDAPVPLPEGIFTPLQAQALLPLLDRAEMRGQPGDRDVFDAPNELADFSDDESEAVWQAIMGRLLSFPEYFDRFVQAFPGVPFGDYTIAHVAEALARFQEVLWERRDSRFDDEQNGFASLSEEEEHGRALFFGDAGCWRCHSGRDFSDDGFHNIGVPQLGPGKDLATGLDEGRFGVTRDPRDRFAFRTPSLRNVRLTAPYMHNGAYASLEAAVRHHFDPEASLRAYDGADLPMSLQTTLRTEPALVDAIVEGIAEDTPPLRDLTEQEVQNLIAFLHTLDSEGELRKTPADGVPERVPSGLPVDRWPGETNLTRRDTL